MPEHAHERDLWAVLDILPFGVILIGSDQAVRGMNTLGHAVLRDADALRFDGARVRATDAFLDERLRSAIAERRPITIRVRRLSPRRAVEVTVVPLASDCSAIILTDPGRPMAIDPEVLRVLYGLTRGEARVVAVVVQGEGSAAAAAQLGVSVNTLRRHLKNIFAKVGVQRQADLVRIVLSGLARVDVHPHAAASARGPRGVQQPLDRDPVRE